MQLGDIREDWKLLDGLIGNLRGFQGFQGQVDTRRVEVDNIVHLDDFWCLDLHLGHITIVLLLALVSVGCYLSYYKT